MKKLTEKKGKALKLAKQAYGALGKVVKMIEEDKYCPDIIQQVDSVLGLVKSSKRELLIGHLDHCLPIKIKENKAETIEELMKIYNLSN
jgi:DNA-binding FrmR family transcriptional regulator